MRAKARASGLELYLESLLKLRSQFRAKGNLKFKDLSNVKNLVKITYTKVEGTERSRVSLRVILGSMSLLGTLIVLFKLRSGTPKG